MDVLQVPQGYRATTRRQFTFNQSGFRIMPLDILSWFAVILRGIIETLIYYIKLILAFLPNPLILKSYMEV